MLLNQQKYPQLAVFLCSFIGKSIRRFPEEGSRYANILKDFRSVDIRPKSSDLLVSARYLLHVIKQFLKKLHFQKSSFAFLILTHFFQGLHFSIKFRSIYNRED